MRQASRKVPDGKMVQVKLEVRNEEVVEAEIRGDFFLEPPEKLSELEQSLIGLKENEEKEKIVQKLDEIEAQLIGFSREDIAEAFRKAGGEK